MADRSGHPVVGARRRSWRGVAVALAACTLAAGWGVGGAPTTLASFTSGTGAGNTVTALTLAAPTVAVQRSPAPDVAVSWGALQARATGTDVYRSITGGAWSLVASVAAPTTSYTDTTAGAGTFHYLARTRYTAGGANWSSPDGPTATLSDPTFLLQGSNAYTGSGTTCPSGTEGSRDMQQGGVPGAAEQLFEGSSSTGNLYFCSDTFTAGQTLAAGTTTVNVWFNNSSGAACTIVAYLYKNTTSLGSGSRAISPMGITEVSWSFATAATTFATGDRLSLRLHMSPSAKACNSTVLHYNAAAVPSSVTVPNMP